MNSLIRISLAIMATFFTYASLASDGSGQLESSRFLLPTKPFRAPLGGDIFFSTRNAKPEAVQIAKSFGANRIEWVYSNDANFVDLIKKNDFLAGLTLNANPILNDDDGYARNFDGEIIVAPWMKSWGAKWATTTSSKTASVILDQAHKLVMAGADSIQFDDPDLQYSPSKWADGDFSSASLDGFKMFIQRADISSEALQLGLKPGSPESYKDFLIRTYGVQSTADYVRRKKAFVTTPLWERYLMYSVREFHISLKKLLSTEKAKYTPLSFNLDIQPEEQSLYMADIPDYVMAESYDFAPVDVSTRLATARAVPTGYVASIVPKDLASTRELIALHYALGAPVVVPWDVYMPDINGVPQPRYYGKPEGFADIFHFVRDNRSLFDQSDVLPTAVIVIPLAKSNRKELRRVVGLLTKHSIPFAFCFSGGVFKKFPLDESKLRKANTLIRLGAVTDFNESDAKVLSALGSGVLTSNMITESWSEIHAPIKIEGAVQVNANFRVTNARTGAIALHLVALVKPDQMPKVVGSLKITIDRKYLPENVKIARLYSVGKTVETINISFENNEVSLLVPHPETWSILSFSNEEH